MEFQGKNALVTGAGSGIGRATAGMLASRGVSKIVLVDVNAASLETTAGEVRAAGAEAIIKAADLTKVAEVVRVFGEADKETGGLDIVHNNAGIMTGPPDFPDTVIERMVAVIELNLIAVMVGVRVAVEQMRARGKPGVIVNTASIAAFHANIHDPAYSTSKAGVVSFTQGCKPLHELFNIRVMAVCPGMVDTAIVPRDAPWLQASLARTTMLHPDDIARAVCAIVADETKSGEYIVVDNIERARA